MVRVFDQKVGVCEIIMVLENNGVPLYALDDVLAKVKEGAEMTPVMVAPPGLPVEVSEQHKNEVMEEYNRRKCAYALAGEDTSPAEDQSAANGEPVSEGAPPPPERQEFYFGLPGQEE